MLHVRGRGHSGLPINSHIGSPPVEQCVSNNALCKSPGFWHASDMITITLEKAQQDLQAVLKRVLAGEEIVIEVDDRRVRLAQEPSTAVFDDAVARRRGYGVLKGKLVVGPEFFEPLSDEECGLGGDEKAGHLKTRSRRRP